jgi:hypothetical protein
MGMDFDLQLRAAIYRHFADTASPPAMADMASTVGAPAAEVRAGYERLYAKRMLVLMPDGESIRMAPPFSGIPTQHVVSANGKEYFANCAWDAFGIPAALHAEADVRSRCEQSGEPLRMHLGEDGLPPSSWIFHVAVPAAHWWRDIVYT